LKHLFFISLVLLLQACSSAPKFNYETPDTSDTAISFWASWVSETKKGLHGKINLRNNVPGKIIINLDDIVCGQGSIEGTFTRLGDDLPAFQSYLKDGGNTRVKYISLERGETKSAETLCSSPVANEGEYFYAVKKVYSNPKGDRQTKGDIIQENVVWTFSKDLATSVSK
jgi:hypothetical protein